MRRRTKHSGGKSVRPSLPLLQRSSLSWAARRSAELSLLSRPHLFGVQDVYRKAERQRAVCAFSAAKGIFDGRLRLGCIHQTSPRAFEANRRSKAAKASCDGKRTW